MSKTLIVVVAARITEWAEKGELSPGYFNPDNRFQRVVVISLIEDNAANEVVGYLCGSKEYSFISLNLLSVSGLLRSVGFSAVLMRDVVKREVVPRLPKQDNFVVRAYGDTFAGKFAAILADALKCRSIASIHTTFTHLPPTAKLSLKNKCIRFLERSARAFAHKNLDILAPVYSPIIASIPAAYRSKVCIIPNAVDVGPENVKTSYSASGILKIVTVGRLVPGKSLLPILHGLRDLAGWHLTVIGNGPCLSDLKDWVECNGKETTVRFIPSMRNKELVEALRNFDVFAAHTSYAEIPKTVIEAGLVGLPVILNRPDRFAASEYENAPILWCQGDAEGYRHVFEDFCASRERWPEIGNASKKHFEKWFSPVFAGKSMADLLSQNTNDFPHSSNEE